MRLIAALTLAAGMTLAHSHPAQAHDDHDPVRDFGRALGDLLQQMEPALDEALDLLQQFQGDYDPRHYDMPEVLPNGDIIMRRRGDAPPFGQDPDEPADELPSAEGTVDL